MADDLEGDFEHLEHCLRSLIGLLDEAGDRFWSAALRRGLAQVEARRLSGATAVLGCYGGAGTFSDHVLSADLAGGDWLAERNLNARLVLLRTRTFDAANAITARRHW